MYKRILIIVMDSVGIGSLPDADDYGDSQADTLSNIARLRGGLFLPNLEKLGLGCIKHIEGVKQVSSPTASYGKMIEISKGKDTTTGHWELAGCPIFKPFPTYPDGFPDEVIDMFLKHTGCKGVLGNISISGTEIIAKFGARHMETGYPIIYTSADSVFQIAAHEEIIPLEKLYELCLTTREKVCIGEYAVGRIIARPFIGVPGKFVRTANRHDYSLTPPLPTILELMKHAGYAVTGVGKIADIFAHQGITSSFPTKSNKHGVDTIIQLLLKETSAGLIMANLVDFDSVYGHRNDVEGYAKALEDLDNMLPLILENLNEEDLLIITADHGCDPTTPGTDHTREYVPLLAYHISGSGRSLGIRSTFADIAATVAENFGLGSLAYGQSFLGYV